MDDNPEHVLSQWRQSLNYEVRKERNRLMNSDLTRRSFLGAGAAALAGCAAPKATAFASRPEPKFMWGVLLHFGLNIQSDIPVDKWGGKKYFGEDLKLMTAADHVRFDEGVFDRLTDRMAAKGLNTIVIDLEEALYYPSHPELAVKGTWSVERFQKKLAQLRAKGLEPIPKLNFSTAHDVWLKEYHKMVSTPKYYQVVSDVISDAIDVFEKPRFFHIGFDEESHNHQKRHSISIVRQGDLWWHDFLHIVNAVEKKGVRAWCWSDKIWHAKKEFLNRMPKSVLQSNWYYGRNFELNRPLPEGRECNYVDAYIELEKAGFDQVPTGSNWSVNDSISATVSFARKHIAPERLKGFLAAPWVKTLPQFEKMHEEQIDQVHDAMRTI